MGCMGVNRRWLRELRLDIELRRGRAVEETEESGACSRGRSRHRSVNDGSGKASSLRDLWRIGRCLRGAAMCRSEEGMAKTSVAK